MYEIDTNLANIQRRFILNFIIIAKCQNVSYNTRALFFIRKRTEPDVQRNERAARKILANARQFMDINKNGKAATFPPVKRRV